MKLTIKILILLILLSVVYKLQVDAQINNVGPFISAGTEDGQKLIKAYLSPYLNAFGASMTGGWYNTAKCHKLGGFDLTATINTAIVPTSAKTFNVDELGLVDLKRANGTEVLSPTIAGKNKSGPQMEYNLPGYTGNAFKLSNGTGDPYISTPMLQLGVGLIKETEIIGRYMPTFSTGDYKIGLWGIGIKHSISQWIPFLKKLPVLHVSVMGGYTNLGSKMGIDVKPSDIGAGSIQTDAGITAQTWENQKMKIEMGSFTGNLLVSVDLPIICFYGGAGFATTSSKLEMSGNYPMLEINNDQPLVIAAKDPINIKVKNQEGNITKARLNAGMRLKLSLLTIHFDYTREQYNVFTGGLGISFR